MSRRYSTHSSISLKNSVPDVTYIHLLISKMLKRIVRWFHSKSTDKTTRPDTNIAAKDSSGRTALHEAAKSGRQTVVRLLIEQGADIAANDSAGRTALHGQPRTDTRR
jgi:hypothetical protein